MKLTLIGKGGTGRGYELWLDEVKQERVVNVILSVDVHNVNTATVTYLIDGAEVEVELPDAALTDGTACGPVGRQSPADPHPTDSP